MLAGLYKQGTEFFERNRIAPEKREVEVWMEGRYPYQVWEIPVRIDSFLKGGRIDRVGLEKMVEAFNDEHEKAFAVREDSFVECVFWRLKAIGRRDLGAKVEEIGHDPVEKIPAACHKGSRKAYFREAGGMVDTPFYLGMPLLYGNKIQGPAVIVEPTTTIAVQPGYTAEVTRYGNYLLLNGNRRAN